jgi:hypothetical protein
LELLVVLTADGNASLKLGMANSQGGNQGKAELVHFICQQNKGVSLSNFNKIF